MTLRWQQKQAYCGSSAAAMLGTFRCIIDAVVQRRCSFSELFNISNKTHFYYRTAKVALLLHNV